jgi:putative ABC transport system permease protein
MAQKYFGNENVQGKHLRVDNQFDLEITGVFQSFPEQSHWHPDFLVSFSTLEDDNIYGRKGLESNWGNNSFGTYILVNNQFDAKKVQRGGGGFLGCLSRTA